MTVLGSRAATNFPFIGPLFNFWGIEGCDSQNLKKLMSQERPIGLLPGGFEEATITSPDEMRFFIKTRKGFIKYALKYGYTIRLVIVMNEHQAFKTVDGMKTLRLFLNKLKIPGVIFWGKLGIGFPPNVKLETVIGKGIKGDRVYCENQQPTDEEINKYH